MPIEQYTNLAQTTLAAAVTASATTLTVSDASTFPAQPRFRIRIDNELLLVTGVNGTTWTVQRGIEGTTAAAHASGATVTHVLTAEGLSALLTNPVGRDQRGQHVFLLSCHKSADELIYLMGSADGIRFSLLNPAPIFVPASGNQRDPSLLVWDGRYYIAHTNATNPYFTVLRSDDLVSWSVLTNVDMSAIPYVFRVWAPEWFVDPADGSVHVFVACSTNGSTSNFQIYEVHPTDDQWTSWSAPQLVTISGKSNVIDPFVVKRGTTYYLWYKEENNHYIEYASASALTGPYTPVKTDDWAGWGSPMEAPCLVQLDANTWRIYINEYNGLDSVAIWYAESTDNWATWSPKQKIVSPWTVAHPTVLRVRDLPTLRNMLALSLTTKGPKFTSVGSTNQSIGPYVTTALSFTSVDRDDLGAWNSAQPTRLTAPVTGLYLLQAHVKWSDASGGKRVLDIRINGNNYIGSASDNVGGDYYGPDLIVLVPYFLQRGDYMEVTVWQNAGGAINVSNAEARMVFLP